MENLEPTNCAELGAKYGIATQELMKSPLLQGERIGLRALGEFSVQRHKPEDASALGKELLKALRPINQLLGAVVVARAPDQEIRDAQRLPHRVRDFGEEVISSCTKTRGKNPQLIATGNFVEFGLRMIDYAQVPPAVFGSMFNGTNYLSYLGGIIDAKIVQGLSGRERTGYAVLAAYILKPVKQHTPYYQINYRTLGVAPRFSLSDTITS